MQAGNFGKSLCAGLVLAGWLTTATAQRAQSVNLSPAIQTNVLLRIIRAEDKRRWDSDLPLLLADKDPKVRRRAVLAAGRIGDERALPALSELLQRDSDADVRQMAAFAVGEIESPAGGAVLLEVLGDTTASSVIRARAVEALGKIAAALPDTEKDRKRTFSEAILNTLKFEAGRRSAPNHLTILLGLTAALRARPDGAGAVIVRFLDHADPRIVADALNTMARLRLKDNNDELRRLLKQGDPIVRANAARALGAAEDKGAFEVLLDRALHDDDLRVRVSAIRTLGALNDLRAGTPLLDRGLVLLAKMPKSDGIDRPAELNEILEIATALGLLLKNSNSERAVSWLRDLRASVRATSPTIEVSFARIAPQSYMSDHPLFNDPATDAKSIQANRQASAAQGLRELATIKTGRPILDSSINEFAKNLARSKLDCRPYQRATRPAPVKLGPNMVLTAMCVPLQPTSVPDFLRAYAAHKPVDLGQVLLKHLNYDDVMVRSTAAELLGGLPPDQTNAQALIEALKIELAKTERGGDNDAVLAIIDALEKQKSTAANDAIKSALNSSDHLIRRRAVARLKANAAGDFSGRIGNVQTRNTEADYRRAISRIGRQVRATVVTSKGAFTIEFRPEEAPLTVDNFVMLARKGFFNGQTIPRVVPNFVVQAGDPRGDQSGGPGYSIRCEVNELPYERAALGMALSGKDTGGSQWFVTHSPQPHLDGGYTVFGRVVSGMDVVDRIVRGDRIRRMTVSER